MHQLLVALCCIGGFSTTAHAQHLEIGPAFGVINYLGDLSGNSLEATQYNVSLGLQGRYHLSATWALGLQANGGTITGSDRYSGNRRRNLSVQTFLVEAIAQVEYRPFQLAVLDGRHLLSPYLAVGAGAFYFNPRAEWNGRYIELQPLGTEGQGMPGYADHYRRIAPVIPVNAGMEMRINERSAVGFALGFRKTFTDYLDDVSGAYPVRDDMMAADRKLAYQLAYRTPEYDERAPAAMTGMRGNPDNVDNYLFAQAHYTVVLGGARTTTSGLSPRRAKGKPTGRLFYTPSTYYGF